MVQSWMGWMELPDPLLSHLAHDGFDAIFASAYANPNGDRTTAETSTDFYARLLFRMRRQDPARMRDLINRAARFGIKVYAPDHLPVPGHAGKRSGAAQAGARHRQGVPRHPGLHPPDRRLLVQAMGRRPRRQQGVRAGLGAELEPGGGDRGRGVPPRESRPSRFFPGNTTSTSGRRTSI